MRLKAILQHALEIKASDIMIIAGLPVTFKVHGKTQRTSDQLLAEDTAALTKELYSLAERPIDTLLDTGDDDFSFSIKNVSRFRVNAFKQRGSLACIIRTVSFALPSYQELGITENVLDFSKMHHGLVLVTGAAGSGKTTTLACLIDQINQSREVHVVTIEDPIEYLHRHKKSIVTQRELYTDTCSYDSALRAALREAPDIILLGEMRDAQTIRGAVTAAETGHLVISTLHTLGVANAVNRIVDNFPSDEKQPIRTQLSTVLRGIVWQKLLPSTTGDLVPAFEVMFTNSAVSNMIRESKEHQLAGVIFSSRAEGMISMDQSIYQLYQAGRITKETAVLHASNPDSMQRRVEA